MIRLSPPVRLNPPAGRDCAAEADRRYRAAKARRHRADKRQFRWATFIINLRLYQGDGTSVSHEISNHVLHALEAYYRSHGYHCSRVGGWGRLIIQPFSR